MPIWFYLIISIAGQSVLWPVFARIHYHVWDWAKTTPEEDRKAASGFWGFLWPLFLLSLILFGVFAVIGWAETTPSLKQRREKDKQLLSQQIKDAERELGWGE